MRSKDYSFPRNLTFLTAAIIIGWIVHPTGSNCSADELATASIDFARDIRPILSDHCFACHGPDAENRQGDLRLDQREGAFGESQSGNVDRIIAEGDPQASELVLRVNSDDADVVMPPEEFHKPLSDEQKELIAAWIQSGAEWKQHWAFLAPSAVDPPAVELEVPAEWPANAIDHFILDQIRKHPRANSLRPNEPAEWEVLFRRLTLDLTGLPPSIEEMDSFQDDLAVNPQGAYEAAVDRLMASPRYGEHMARYWLDHARYGDTHGLHLDNYREMWAYRDWVVNAFNSNMPFDQFAIEQLAGDMLDNPTDEQLVATGFVRSHVTTSEGGAIVAEVDMRNVVDRVTTFGTVFLGLTMDCTRCHDHKYDPLTMKDFYSLYAYFNSLEGNPLDGNKKDHAPVLRLPSDQQKSRLDELTKQIASARSVMSRANESVDNAQLDWERSVGNFTKSAAVEWGPWSFVGPFTGDNAFAKEFGPESEGFDSSLSFKSDGKALKWQQRKYKDGTAHSFESQVSNSASYVHRTISAKEPTIVAISLGSDDGIKVFLNGELIHSLDVARGLAPDQDKIVLHVPEGESDLLLKIVNRGGNTGFYFSAGEDPKEALKGIADAFRIKPEFRDEEQAKAVRSYFRQNVSNDELIVGARKQIAAMEKEKSKIKASVPTTLICRELAKPKPAKILLRGEYDQPGEEVTRATPAILPDFDPSLPQNRLGLARWLFQPDHPLTARVTVNRLWQQFFGRGLVETAEDFGAQGSPPSHPELLDWLAVQLRNDEWDLKRTIKRIVMSATYRQSSYASPTCLELDPGNELLARGPRFRLDAEVIRDQALAASGLLVDKLGGPSVKPPQPDGLWFAVGYSGSNTVRFVADKEFEKRHRRSLYTFIKRTSPPPQMSTFDGPSREVCTVRRERTNTPLQALLMLNDPQFFDAAKALAGRTLESGEPTDELRARYMFRLCVGREPEESELEKLVAAVQRESKYYAENPSAAEEMLADVKSDNHSDLAAWTLVANTILNLDEVLTKN